MLRPSSIFLPLRFFVGCVINLQVALVAAIFSFIPVAWGEECAAPFASTIRDDRQSVEQDFLAFKKDRSVFVNPIAESTDTGFCCDVQNPSRCVWFVMFANVSTKDSVTFANGGNLSDKDMRSSNGNEGVLFLRDVNTPVPIKDTTYKMIRKEFRNSRVITQFPNSCGKIARANANGRDFRFVTNGMLGFESASETLNMQRINRRQSETQPIFMRATIGVEKPKPIGFAFVVDGIKESCINIASMRFGHGYI